MTTFQTFKDFVKKPPLNIQEKCGPFLEKSEGLPLYRGHGGQIVSLIAGAREVQIRKDRRPRDSTNYVHGLLDAYFQKRFGVKVRSEGFFATGNRGIAETYGHPHYVLPVGNFRFVWATYKDGHPVVDTLNVSRKIENKMRVRYEREAEQVVADVMAEYMWRVGDLPTAIRSGSEIAILAERAIIIPVSEDVSYKQLISR